jgi:hypothetical protein
MHDLDDLEYVVTEDYIGDTGTIIIVDDNLYVITTVSKTNMGTARKLAPARRILTNGPDALTIILTRIRPLSIETLKLTRILEGIGGALQPVGDSRPNNRMSEVWLLRAPRR